MSDSDLCPQGNEQNLDKELKTTTGDFLKEDWITDINNNTTTTMIHVSGVAVSASPPTTEPLAAKKQVSSAEKLLTRTEVGNDSGDASNGEQISSQTFGRRCGPEEKSSSPERENHQDFSDVAYKCE